MKEHLGDDLVGLACSIMQSGYYDYRSSNFLEVAKINAQYIDTYATKKQREALDEAFFELRSLPKDSWYGTMNEILNRFTPDDVTNKETTNA